MPALPLMDGHRPAVHLRPSITRRPQTPLPRGLAEAQHHHPGRIVQITDSFRTKAGGRYSSDPTHMDFKLGWSLSVNRLFCEVVAQKVRKGKGAVIRFKRRQSPSLP
jgi:hypothetical protein